MKFKNVNLKECLNECKSEKINRREWELEIYASYVRRQRSSHVRKTLYLLFRKSSFRRNLTELGAIIRILRAVRICFGFG